MAGNENNQRRVAVILLAAGSSSRLGHPKQLLNYNGKTLLQRALEVAAASGAAFRVLVLGSDAEMIQKTIDAGDAMVVINDKWQEGMASSIRCGLAALADRQLHPESAIIMVCDQPFVTSALLNDLMVAHERSGKPVVACGYDGTFGPPVLFHKSLFPELLQLQGDVGARSIIRAHTTQVEVIPFERGGADVDTEADYQELSAQSS